MASFRSAYTSLLLCIAGSTDRDLARQVAYLRAENQILRRRLPQRLILTEREKSRLIRFAKNLGGALRELVSIVHPGTLQRWIRQNSARHSKRRKQPKPGRKRTAATIEKIVLKLARESSWGYTRILGELKKLGIGSVSKSTVKNILKRNGFDIGPKRGPGTWDEFIRMHAKSLWQCDFFSKRVVSSRGIRQLYALVFIHVQSRRVYVSPATYHPDQVWVAEQTEAFQEFAREQCLPCRLVMHDRDTKFSAEFRKQLRSRRTKSLLTSIRSPNLCAYVERFIQTIQQECLDYFVIFGRRHFDYLTSQFVEHYHEERPHQGLKNQLLTKPAATPPPNSPVSPDTSPLKIRCQERLGGLLKSYRRAA